MATMTIMVHAFSREFHNLLSVWNMPDSNRLSTTQHTQDTETGCACLEPGHTMIWLLGTSTISYYQEMAAEEQPTSLEPHDRAERLYDKESLPHPTRSPITALRTLFGIAMLVGSCILSAPSRLSAAELFPFPSQSSPQSRSIERQPTTPPQLSAEDEKRISRIASQTKQLSPSDRSQLKSSIQDSLNEAVANGKLNQAQYFRKLLRQID
jgi:hypothetical protein